MLKVILNGIKPHGLRAEDGSTEQIFILESFVKGIFNISKICTMSSSISRKSHAALWAPMRKYGINANLFCTVEQLYDKATSAVQMVSSTGEWF